MRSAPRDSALPGGKPKAPKRGMKVGDENDGGGQAHLFRGEEEEDAKKKGQICCVTSGVKKTTKAWKCLTTEMGGKIVSGRELLGEGMKTSRGKLSR